MSWRQDPQANDIQQNDIQQNTLNWEIQLNNTQHQHLNAECLVLYCYADCRYAEFYSTGDEIGA